MTGLRKVLAASKKIPYNSLGPWRALDGTSLRTIEEMNEALRKIIEEVLLSESRQFMPEPVIYTGREGAKAFKEAYEGSFKDGKITTR